MFYARLSLSSLLNNRRQYQSLFAVCMAGVAIMLSAVTVTDGMLRAVRQKARQYYGGDLQFMGGWHGYDMNDVQSLIDAIRPHAGEGVQFFTRFEYDAHNSALFYEGESVRQRVFKGVDFDAEAGLFARFTFTEGAAASSPEHDTLVISEPIASRLGIRAGDALTLQVHTIHGYTNTMTLTVTGIFQDSSLFGMYTSYIDIEALRRATGYRSTYANRICLYYPGAGPTEEQVLALQEALEGEFHMYPQTDDKARFTDALHAAPEDQLPLYALITLDANIKDLQLLIDAIRTVIVLITAILAAIISVGIGSTYRVIVMKRITEIGTYRALGMKASGVRALFLTEAFCLLLAGFAAGIAATLAATFILSRFSFSFIPAFDIFLIDGRLRPVLRPGKEALLLGIITVTTLLSVLFTIRNVVRISPVGALATTA